MLITAPSQTRRALLTWQQPIRERGRRDRMAIGELVQHADRVAFDYLPEGVEAAREQGFDGYPGLTQEDGEAAMRVLLRRLPPRGRGDFGEYLEAHGLAGQAELSDLSLLAYTGARIISDSDGFGVTETFEGFERPFRYPFEVAGYRHYRDAVAPLEPGDTMRLRRDDDNPKDPNAVEVVTAQGARAGYINRLQAPVLRAWMEGGEIALRVFRIGTRPAYPRLFVMADIGGE